MTTSELAKKYSRTTKTILVWAKELRIGKKISPRKNAPMLFTPEEVKKMHRYSKNLKS